MYLEYFPRLREEKPKIDFLTPTKFDHSIICYFNRLFTIIGQRCYIDLDTTIGSYTILKYGI